MTSAPGPPEAAADRSSPAGSPRLPSVRDAVRGERRPVCEMLGRAFEDDPVASFLFPRPDTRARRMATFYRGIVADMVRHGRLHTEPELRAAAVWQAPAPPRPGTLAMIGSSLWMLGSLREALPRAQELGALLQNVHPKEPHWYLAILGTDPPQQGRGLGSAILAPTLRECDDTGMPAYLESSKEQNLPFYERHGFQVMEVLHVPSGPDLWAMWREPRGAK